MEWNVSTTIVEPLPAFAEVVENVRDNRPEGLDQLYCVFRMLSGPLRRQIGFQDFEDRMHDVFLLVVDAIRDGRLREPGALCSYIQGVARLTNFSTIGNRVRQQRNYGMLRYLTADRNRRNTPEDQIVQQERVQIMRDQLASLSDREREVLTRFYLHEQTREEICRDMDLTETQFRLTKSRAKQRLERISSVQVRRAGHRAAA